MKKPSNAMLVIILFFSACDGITHKKSEEQTKQVGVLYTDSLFFESDIKPESDSESRKLIDIEVKPWIHDFKDFRMAIYNNDLPKLKSYFDFPFDDPGTTILHLAKISEEDWKLREKQCPNAELFYEPDLQNYYKKIFDERFTKCVLKIKSEILFSDHIYRTEMFEEPEIIYQMIAEFFPKDRLLRLNMAFGNNFKDENGALISEGEHNVIYTFKIIDQKKLKLQRIDVAG